MRRQLAVPRPHWQKQAEENGFIFHHCDGELYWDESAYYTFTLEQIENDIEAPTEELHQMCLQVVDKAVQDEHTLQRLGIPAHFWQAIIDSWHRNEASLYGRFDFGYTGNGPAKLYEYNADTPTSLYEAAFFQWLWLEDSLTGHRLPQGSDQFNSLQEGLIEHFRELNITEVMHFACVKDSAEDYATVHYLRDCAEQAGINTQAMYMEDIAADSQNMFVDHNGYAIRQLFKLYPWEFMVNDTYGSFVEKCDTTFFEPPWKMILSNKGLLALLWEQFPNHPNLLASWFHGEKKPPVSNYVLKPLFSREGANIQMFKSNVPYLKTEGQYGAEGLIGQELMNIQPVMGNYPVIGSWVVGETARGIGIREDKSFITANGSRFIPHIIMP